jgi:hypothetical protein
MKIKNCYFPVFAATSLFLFLLMFWKRRVLLQRRGLVQIIQKGFAPEVRVI